MYGFAPLLFLIALYFTLSTFALSIIITPLVNRASIYFKFLDKPGNRKIHEKPIPMSGGINIILSMTLIFVFNLIFISLNPAFFSTTSVINQIFSSIDLFIKWKEFVVLAIAALVIWFSGLIDDYYKLEKLAIYKLIAQIIVACIIVFYEGIHITFFKPIFFSQILSVLWIIGIINSFNLIDNMDGLSCGIALICTSILLGIAIWQGEIIVVTISSILIGALASFLLFNFHPAKIFLGDNGSMLIGFFMSILTLKISYMKNSTAYFFPILIPVIILAIPLVDTFSVIFIRIKNKKPIYVGDKNHISHRLLEANFSIRESVLMIYLLTLATAISGFMLIGANLWFSMIIVFQAFVIIFLFLLLLVKRKTTFWRKK